MKQVLVRRGQVSVEEVPAPQVEPGTVLVRLSHSCISAGTELSGIKASGAPLWKRALREPDKVVQVASMAAGRGVGAARDLVAAKTSSASAIGYSAAGLVVAVGQGIDDLAVGDHVACAGAGLANHAEIVRVPRNLVVTVPAGLDLRQASTVTLGAIALQGVRRAQPTLGETFVVIGLGILGQLTAQLLKANGCAVIGLDVDQDRVRMATELGMEMAIDPAAGETDAQVARLTGGIGADGVIVTAATPSSEVISTAFRVCRKKGRVVLVGDVGLDLNRSDIYEKELDFLVSTSYGPGRYDRGYEERGLDYPVGYVRWTENRNMEAYLRLLGSGQLQVEPLIGGVHPVGEAPNAYASLDSGSPRPLIVLLEYADTGSTALLASVAMEPRRLAPKAGRLGVAVVGAGSFARGMHLPNLQALSELFRLRAVVSRTGHQAAQVASQFGAEVASTDLDAVLEDPEVDVVLIATRHDNHAELALRALGQGKHVLVEKPLALSREQLDAVRTFFADAERAGRTNPILLTGFNRRFSPHAVRIAELIAGRSNPMIVTYRMNAGHIPLDSWVHGPSGGGRNLGEACHIYDLVTYLTGARVDDVRAAALRPATAYYGRTDNFVATMSFDDGSLASLTYTALGSPEHPKEAMEVFVDGRVIALDDYRTLTVRGGSAKGLSTRPQDKGHRAELEAFAAAIRAGGPWPIPLWQQVQATEIALRVESFLEPGA